MNKATLVKSLVFAFLVSVFFGCNVQEKKDWKKAESENTASSYENFLSEHPDGKLADKAKAQINKFPKLEPVHVDTSSVLTHNNVYGQPDYVFSGDGHPIIEYSWHQAWISGVRVNFYMKNSRGPGKSEIAASVTRTKKASFEVKADTTYVIRVFIKEFGISGPWNMTQWMEYPVKLQAGSFEDSIRFQAPLGVKRATDKFELLDFEIGLDELPDAGKVDPSNLPDKAFFNDRECDIAYRYCVVPNNWILLRSDGLIGHANSPRSSEGRSQRDHYRFDGDDKWEVKDGFLILSWNRAFASEKYSLTNKNAEYLFGTHSNDFLPLMLRLRK